MRCIVIFIVASTLAQVAGAQTEVHKAAVQAFHQKFPAATAVEWEEWEDGVWGVDFKLNGANMSAAFDAEGEWLETEIAIKIKDLPEPVQAAIARDFPDYEAAQAQKVETTEGIFYAVELEGGDGDEETTVEALYSTDGVLLQLEEEEEEEEEDGDHD